jgi:hypothetical protein
MWFFWQGCEATIWVKRFSRSTLPVNEVIFGMGFRITHLVTGLLKLMKPMCRMLSIVKL